MGDTPEWLLAQHEVDHYGCGMAGWSSDVDCYPAVKTFLKRLEQAGWVVEKRVGEYVHVVCNCGDEHRARVILNPCLPDVLKSYIRVIETTSCFE